MDVTNANDASLIDPTVTEIKFLDSKELERNTVREVVATQTCNNTGNDKVTECTFTLRETRSNTVSSSWSEDFGFSFGAELGLNLEVFEGKASFSRDFNWGKSESHEEKVEIGTDISAKTNADPGESVIAYLTAERGTLKVALNYAATLGGYTHIVFEDDIDDWRKTVPTQYLFEYISKNITRKGLDHLKSTQIVEITVFSNARIIIEIIKPTKLK